MHMYPGDIYRNPVVEKYLAYCARVSSDIYRNPVVEKYLAYCAHVSSDIYRNPVVEKYLAYCARVSSDIYRNPVVEKYLAYYAHVSRRYLQEPSSREISCLLCTCIQWYLQEPRQGKNLRNACSVGQYVCLFLRAQIWGGESRLIPSEHNREWWIVFLLQNLSQLTYTTKLPYCTPCSFHVEQPPLSLLRVKTSTL